MSVIFHLLQLGAWCLPASLQWSAKRGLRLGFGVDIMPLLFRSFDNFGDKHSVTIQFPKNIHNTRSHMLAGFSITRIVDASNLAVLADPQCQSHERFPHIRAHTILRQQL